MIGGTGFGTYFFQLKVMLFFFEDSHMTNSDMRGISLFSQRVLDYKKNSLCKGLYF